MTCSLEKLPHKGSKMVKVSKKFLELSLNSSASTSRAIKLVINNSNSGRFTIDGKHPKNSDIANILNVSKKSISRIIPFLCKNGLLKRVNRKLYVSPYMVNLGMNGFELDVYKEMWDSDFTITREEAVENLLNKIEWR